MNRSDLPSLDDPILFASFMDEFKRLAEAQHDRITAELSFADAWALLSTIQLACRHPDFRGLTRERVERAARKLQELIAPDGALAAVAEAGWDPRADVEPVHGREQKP